MSFRRRLLLLFAILVFVSVAAVAWIVSTMARRAFDRTNDERTAALVADFRREFSRRGEEVARRAEAASSTGEAARMSVAAAQSSPNYNAFLDDAQTVAQIQRLDFLEFCDDRGTIVSSAQWPAKFGYNEPLVGADAQQAPFLKIEETPSGSALGLFAIHVMRAGDRKLFVIGGVRLDRTFLSTLELPAGMRVMIYENLEQGSAQFSPGGLIAAGDSVPDPQQLAPVINKVQREPRESSAIIHWSSGSDETVNAFPLVGDKNQLLGVLLVGSSRQVYIDLRNQIRSAALLAASAGLVLAIGLSSWAAARVTRPIERLAQAAGEVAGGNWKINVEVDSRDEIGQLAESFNRMTRELLDQHDRLVQAERVAAWRELARRLAHELKNPLFPLQLTVENLLRARESGEQEFDATFRESATTLLSEIANLKNIIGRFSEFSKMPQPHFQEVQLNELVENVAKVHQAQLERTGISCRLDLSAGPIVADPDLLHRAMSNLVLNAIDAMPQGGALTLRTRDEAGSARIEVSDTGMGIKPEERERLFTPYYTSKAHGTGLGLAIVQSIVSDHGGRISVESEPGRGTTFIIELPPNSEKISTLQGTHV